MSKRFRLVCLVSLLISLVLSACGPVPITGPQHATQPGVPVYSQMIFDCNTGDQANGASLIQPDAGCDNWEINRYERPFNAESQDEFFPDLDILSAELGTDGNWFYARLSLYDVSDENAMLEGSYGMEFDLDLDGRGDVLVLAQQPDEGAASDWSEAGVQFYGDSNNDVGNKVPLVPDSPSESDGYDTVVFNQGQGDDPDLAWVRWQGGQPAYVEIALKASALYYAPSFKWRAWSDRGVDDPGEADYHDSFDHSQAGDAIQGQTYFPSKAINELDNTCASIWGADPSDDPELCVNDSSVQPPVVEGSPTPEVSASPSATTTPTLPLVTATPSATKPNITDTPTPGVSQTPCTLAGQSQDVCTPTPTPSPTQNTPTSTPTVCFIYDQTGQLIDCTPTPTPSPTPTDCYNQYPFANVPCTPTPTYTPSATPTLCYSNDTATPTPTLDPNSNDTATSTPSPNPNSIAGVPANGLVPCTPTPTPSPTATICVNGANFAALVQCSPTPTPTQCIVSGNTSTTVIICSPTPTPTICVTVDAATGQQMPCPTLQTAAMMVYPQKNTNCRQAPDSSSQAYDTLMLGEGYVPLGRTPDNLYMLFRGPVTGVRCWAAAFLFDIPFGPLNQVPGAVLPYINYPTPTPTEKPSGNGGGKPAATATPTCPPKGTTKVPPAGCP